MAVVAAACGSTGNGDAVGDNATKTTSKTGPIDDAQTAASSGATTTSKSEPESDIGDGNVDTAPDPSTYPSQIESILLGLADDTVDSRQ